MRLSFLQLYIFVGRSGTVFEHQTLNLKDQSMNLVLTCRNMAKLVQSIQTVLGAYVRVTSARELQQVRVFPRDNEMLLDKRCKRCHNS